MALDKMLIGQLHQIAEKAAFGLSGANLTVLSGAEGSSEMATRPVAQGKAIFDALRGDLMDYEDQESPDIQATARSQLRDEPWPLANGDKFAALPGMRIRTEIRCRVGWRLPGGGATL